MTENLTTIEGCYYKINLNFTGQEDLADYEIYGAACRLGCSKHHTDFKITEKTDNTCTLIIPPLNAGTHLYQIFIKRQSTNQEFLLLDGRIEVSNRCGDVEHQSINSTAAELDVVFNADEVTVNVTINEGTKGERGERGEKGEQGEKGDPGESASGGGVDWAEAGEDSQSNNPPTNTGINSLAIGYNSVATGVASIAIGSNAKTNSNDGSIAIGRFAEAQGPDSVAVGQDSHSGSGSVTIGKNAWGTANYSIAIGSGTSNSGEFSTVIGYGGRNRYSGVTHFVTTTPNSNTTHVYIVAALSELSLQHLNGASGLYIEEYNGNTYAIPFSQLSSSGDSEDTNTSFDYGTLYKYANKFKHFDSMSTLESSYPYWKNELDENGAWNYNLEKMTDLGNYFNDWGEDSSSDGLKSFNSYMGDINSLSNCFYNCYNLESFNCATPMAFYADYCFQYCTKLKHFRGDLSNLQNGYGMFGSSSSDCCQLDLASVQHIARVIPSGSGNTISLGVSNTLNGNSDLETAVQEIRDKFWSVDVYYSDFG